MRSLLIKKTSSQPFSKGEGQESAMIISTTSNYQVLGSPLLWDLGEVKKKPFFSEQLYIRTK
jgi:hypothetical protein